MNLSCVPTSKNRTLDSPTLTHLSYSSLSTYSLCPRKFLYRYIELRNPEFQSAALIFGAAFHRAVEALHKARIAGAPLPAPEQLLVTFDESWECLAFSDVPVIYPQGEDKASLRRTAMRMLDLYSNHVAANSDLNTHVIGIENTETFRLCDDLPPIQMRADLIELNQSGHLVVTDIKTSRARWAEIKVRESLPQLLLYSCGLQSLADSIGATKLVPRFCVITKGKTPVLQQIEPVTSAGDFDRLKRNAVDIWNGIRKEVFVQRQGWHCAHCPFRSHCLGL